MIKAPRISPPATATRVLKPSTTPATTPPLIVDDGLPPPVGPPRARLCRYQPRRSRSASLSMAASAEALISSVCSVTPLTVATTTPVIRESSPRTIRPAARVGLNLWRTRKPARGLKHTARTAANVNGRTSGSTAPSAMTMMAVVTTNPTKLQDRIPCSHPAKEPRHIAGDRAALRSVWLNTSVCVCGGIGGLGHARSPPRTAWRDHRRDPAAVVMQTA